MAKAAFNKMTSHQQNWPTFKKLRFKHSFV
jgi:hypothetical protein